MMSRIVINSACRSVNFLFSKYEFGKHDISLSLLSNVKANDGECAIQRARAIVEFFNYYNIYPEQSVPEIIDYLCIFRCFNPSFVLFCCTSLKVLFIIIPGICLGIFKVSYGSHHTVPEPMCLPTMTQAGHEHVTQCNSLVHVDALRIAVQRQTCTCTCSIPDC